MSKFAKAMLPVLTFARIDIKRLFRDRVAMFFVFFFPLIFLVIFGSVFRNDDGLSFRVALLNQSDTQFARQFADQIRGNDVFEVDDQAADLEQARELMGRGQLEATIILPQDFGVERDGLPRGEARILYDQSNQQAGQALGTLVEAVFDDINQRLAPAQTPFSVRTESTITAGMTPFDYTFAGILGFTMLSLGVFGPTQVFPRLKQRGVLRRYHTTPLKVWQYFTGNVISNAVIGLMAIALMFVIATIWFDLSMRGSYLNLAVVVVLGVTMLFGIGLALGGWAKNENQAAPLAQIVALPMMFLSGVFIPTFLMPDVLQRVTQFIPLTPIVESVRRIITENASLLDLAPQLGLMVVWLVIIYILAFRLFRWE